MPTEQNKPTKQDRRKIAIITDGGCDITNEEAAQRGFTIVPTPLVFPDGTTSNSNDFSTCDFWTALLSDYTTLPKTSQPNSFSFECKLQELADEGFEEVLILAMSSGLSATIESAITAAEQAPIPTRVLDSRSVTWGLVVLCDAAVRGANAGLTLDELVNYVQAIRDTLGMYFVVDTLEYLVRGGRAGRAAGLLAAALDIKPILTVESDGVIAPVKKCRGRKKAYQKMAGMVTEQTTGMSNLHYFTLFTNDRDDAEELHAELKKAGFTTAASYDGMQQVGIIVGIYAGPGTSALVYWQDLDAHAYRTE